MNIDQQRLNGEQSIKTNQIYYLNNDNKKHYDSYNY
jgi:hypothetical protein